MHKKERERERERERSMRPSSWEKVLTSADHHQKLWWVGSGTRDRYECDKIYLRVKTCFALLTQKQKLEQNICFCSLFINSVNSTQLIDHNNHIPNSETYSKQKKKKMYTERYWGFALLSLAIKSFPPFLWNHLFVLDVYK